MFSKIRFLTLGLLFVPFALLAEGFNTMIITKSNGEQTRVALDKSLRISFDENALTASSEYTSCMISLSDIEDWSFANESASIEEVTQDAITFDGTSILIPNDSAKDVKIYDNRGRLVKISPIDATGKVKLTNLAPGTYIINVANLSLKLNIK